MLEVAASQAQGRRAHMEDFVHVEHPFAGHADWLYVGVFDGHGGATVARRAAQEIYPLLAAELAGGSPPQAGIARAFRSFDDRVASEAGGAVAGVVLLQGRGFTVANAGDVTVLVVSSSEERVVTKDHRLTNPQEAARVAGAGAVVEFPYAMLPDGRGLMPTRTLGDRDFRAIGVLADPDIAVDEWSPEDPWIVVGSDGVFDALEPREVAGHVRRAPTAKEAADRIRDEALRAGDDNVTAVVIRNADLVRGRTF